LTLAVPAALARLIFDALHVNGVTLATGAAASSSWEAGVPDALGEGVAAATFCCAPSDDVANMTPTASAPSKSAARAAIQRGPKRNVAEVCRGFMPVRCAG